MNEMSVVCRREWSSSEW